ncbi:MAG: TIM barrel protein, partial [Alphaproteobacteria bacterium]
MPIKIGINPLTWTNDDMPELGGETPLETCLAEAMEAGYEGIEMGHKFPRTAAELGPILDRHGLALVSGWHSANLVEHSVEEEIAAVEEHLALMAGMGCKVMVFAETGGSTHGDREAPISTRPRLSDDDWGSFGERLTRVGEHLASRGVA